MISRGIILILSMVLAATPAMGQDFIYLFPSKEIAETGEDLFFKAYLLNRQTMALSDKSRTLYLEIRSERDSLVWSEKYPLVGGRGDGHVYIGENWPQGEYFFEGYAKTSFTADSTEAIRGDIFNPTYYFDERNANRLQALDLLLMTQGWRRYVWD